MLEKFGGNVPYPAGDSGIVIFNPLHAKFSRGNKNICLYFMLFLHIDMAQVAEISPRVRQESTYSIVVDRAGTDPRSPIPEPNA